MPYHTFGLEEVARYLHLSPAEVEGLVKRQELPFEKRGGRLVFRKTDIETWASRRILGLEGKHLAEYHQKTTRATQDVDRRQALLPERLQPEFIDASLPAKTKASVLREMVLLAGKTGRLCDPDALLAGLKEREELCSTGVPGGLALLHPRHREEYLFESAFIVLGRTVQQIPFGAPDGRPTDLFFLVACPDDRMHLHVLARLCLMAQKTPLLEELRQAPTAESMYDIMIKSELAVL